VRTYPQVSKKAEGYMSDHIAGGQGAASPAAGGSQVSQAGGNPAEAHAGDPGLTQEQLSAIQEQIGKHGQENQQLKATIDRMKEALGVPQPQEAENDDAWYDDMLKIAFELEKQGRGIPVTVDLATRLRGTVEESKQLKQVVKQLQAQMKQISNPETLHNQRVYENIDNTINDTIEGLYGEVDPIFAEYVATKVSQEIKSMQAKEPEKWQRLRASEREQARLVAGIVKQAVPGSIREKLKQDYLANSPMTEEELVAAYKQADQITDLKMREKVKTAARQQYWEQKFTKNKQNSFRGMMERVR
jgi:hypothetical protein